MQLYDPLSLLQLLTAARGPCGQENEIRSVCSELMKPLCDHLREDPSGNLVGKIEGKDSKKPPIRVIVHMDELSMIVKRVNSDGTLSVNSLGALHPFNCGQGPVEIMGDRARIPGILSFGCMHVTKESTTIKKFVSKASDGKNETMEWEDTYIVTRKSVEQLKALGVHAGTRVVIAQSRRKLEILEDCVAGYFMDNRAAIAAAFVCFNHFKAYKQKPAGDVYLVASVAEEIGGHGACYASNQLPGDITIAIDVGPVAKEYQTELNSSPIIVYKDRVALYDKGVSDRLTEVAYDIGLEPQQAIFGSYGSDASLPKSYGLTAKAALIAIPTENTHGYEIIHRDGINKCAELLYSYLLH